jgi:hypothetical protein
LDTVIGGLEVTVTGQTYVPGATIYLNTQPMLTTFIDQNHLKFKVPQGLAPQTYDLSVWQLGLQAVKIRGFSIELPPTKTFVSSSFEDGTLGTFLTDTPSRVLVSSEAAHSGSKSVKTVINGPTNGNSAALIFRYGNVGVPNPPVTEANGLFQRWFLKTTQATVNAVNNRTTCTDYAITTGSCGQMKILLNRYSTSGVPGWFHIGVGVEFGSVPDGQVNAFRDSGVALLKGTRTPIVLQDGVWYEFITWYKRDTATGVGFVKLWINGKLMVDDQHALLGADDPTYRLNWDFGTSFVQHSSGPTLLYVDDVEAANGYTPPPGN